jgi:hypothetical protein
VVDVNLLVLQYLLGQSEVTALLGTNLGGSIYCGFDLPEHFDPNLGPVIQIFRIGGHAHDEILSLVDAKVHIRVWALPEDAGLASQVYGAINDVLHGTCNATVTAGTIVRALEATGPLEFTDPDNGWVAVYAFYEVMARPNGSSTPHTPAFYEGYGSPTVLEMNGDIYFDLSTGNIWEQVGTLWVDVGNVPQGGGSTEMSSLNYHKVAAAGTNAANIKAAGGFVAGWNIFNDTEFPLYVKLFNLATAPIPGSSLPQQTIAVQAGQTAVAAAGSGLTYSTGIAIAITGNLADLDATPVSAGSCVVDIFYQ